MPLKPLTFFARAGQAKSGRTNTGQPSAGPLPYKADNGVHPVNPFSLVELLVGPVAWGRVPDRLGLVAQVLGVPRATLFDARTSPLFVPFPDTLAVIQRGFNPAAAGPYLSASSRQPAGQAMAPPAPARDSKIGGLFGSLGISCAQWARMGTTQRQAFVQKKLGYWNVPMFAAIDSFCGILPQPVAVQGTAPTPAPGSGSGFGSPAVGRIPETPVCAETHTDSHGYTITYGWVNGASPLALPIDVRVPRQGSLGDCYFMAALASVAFTRPSIISAPMTTGVVAGAGSPTYAVTLYSDSPLGPGAPARIGVTQRHPIITSASYSTEAGEPIYAHCQRTSGDAFGVDGAAWAPIFEKAHAAWILGSYDPDCTNIKGALGHGSDHNLFNSVSHLTGTAPIYHIGDGFEDYLRSVCPGGVASVPLITSTLPVLPIIGGPVDVVPEHCYSVLGYLESGGTFYVVVRNPWGTHQPWGPGTPTPTESAALPWNGMYLGGFRDAGAIDAYNFGLFFDGGLIYGAA